jgi:ribosomal 50S subunit-recycling heat shock protein
VATKKKAKATSKKPEVRVNGKKVKPGTKVKLEEHMRPAQIAQLVAQKAAEKEAGDADDLP